jgi:coenzyme F420 hydrogenase subunit beta
MGDALAYGRRPFIKKEGSKETGEALAVCPGVSLEHRVDANDPGLIAKLFAAWGPVREVFEGFASDDEVRFAGSSGGVATALALYCIQVEGMKGVLHSAERKDRPLFNHTRMSRSRGQLLEAAGSRYAPASPCDGLYLIEESNGHCVFIGKPCDVAGVQFAKKVRPALNSKLGATIAIFCAGVPSTMGSLELLRRVGIRDVDSVKELRYRGNGWPGHWTATYEQKDGVKQTKKMSYYDSWGFLQRYRQWRCYICPDHSGEFADIAVADPWYREIEEGEPGRSLIIARTKRGQDIIKHAADAGYITIASADPTILPRSQPELLKSRGALWARLPVLRLMGVPVPKYRGFSLFPFWLELSFNKKVQSVFGTVRRVFVKKLRKRVELSNNTS